MKTLIVWMAGARVGQLIRKDNGNLQFRYDAGYDGPAVSQSLPGQDAAHPHAPVRAVFGGLLPEGDVRSALAQTLGVSETNDYGLLAEVGGDVAGALTLLPEGAEPAGEPASMPLDDATLDRMLRELPQRPLAFDADEGIRLSLAGAQAKVPVIIGGAGVALPTNAAAPTTHILKPEPARFPGLVDNEAFCMELARSCEIPVARVRKQTTTSGVPFLVVERYDRDLTADPIRRLHQEDTCQALGRPADRKYQQEGGPSVVEVAELIRACSPVPAQELPRLLRAVAFNWIVGNCDAHGKNYSLLYDQGAPTLAPLYDLVSTVIYPELTTRLAMSIDGARMLGDVSPGAWATLAKEARYRLPFVEATVDELLTRAASEAQDLSHSPEHGNNAAAKINERIQALAADWF